MDTRKEGGMERVLVRAREDETFRARLLADPAAALREEGVELPPDIELRVLENTATRFHLVVPQEGQVRELSDEDLEQVNAAFMGPRLNYLLDGVVRFLGEIAKKLDEWRMNNK